MYALSRIMNVDVSVRSTDVEYLSPYWKFIDTNTVVSWIMKHFTALMFQKIYTIVRGLVEVNSLMRFHTFEFNRSNPSECYYSNGTARQLSIT